MGKVPCEICDYCWGKLLEFHDYYKCVAEAQKNLRSRLVSTVHGDEQFFTTGSYDGKCDYVSEFIKDEFLTYDTFRKEDVCTKNPLLEHNNTVVINTETKFKPKKRAKIKIIPKRKKPTDDNNTTTNEELIILTAMVGNVIKDDVCKYSNEIFPTGGAERTMNLDNKKILFL